MKDLRLERLASIFFLSFIIILLAARHRVRSRSAALQQNNYDGQLEKPQSMAGQAISHGYSFNLRPFCAPLSMCAQVLAPLRPYSMDFTTWSVFLLIPA